MKKNIFIVILLLAFGIFLTGCTDKATKENLLGINYETVSNIVTLDKYDTENPIVAMNVSGYGSIVMELYPNYAPNTVSNFISLVKNGFYDNNTIHRLSKGFVIQGGDPTGTGFGGCGYTIKGEFSKNGIKNDLKHEKGIVSMARSQEYDSAGSQFFIVLGNASHLDSEYAAFGKVIDGWENVENIANNEQVSDPNSGRLTKNLIIKKALVDLKGKTYDKLDKIEEK